ncbi:MAG: WYL domain-containing protein [candidate division Zixibacteria bacterium]|nr:WYL domain-containing protein [candidate division Zixibacteria bacterium]
MQPEIEISAYLREQTFVAFDTETTGLWAPANRVIEIGAVKFRCGQSETEVFESLVNPKRSIPPESIRVHGITDDMLVDAPEAAGVIADFMSFCSPDSILIAHNAPFDISFVGCELERAELDFGENTILDTVDLFQRYVPGLSSYSLLGLARHYSIAETQDHRALGDAVLVQKLFELIAPKFGNIKKKSDFSHMASTYAMDDWRAQQADLPQEHSELNRARDEKLRVHIVYQTPSNQPTTRVIRPEHFYQLGEIYYINAYCERARGERTFRLDRIGEFKVIE